MDELEQIIPARRIGKRQHLVVERAEHMVHAVRQRGRAPHRPQAEDLAERHVSRWRRAAAGEPGDRPRQRLQRIAHQRREDALAPALGELLHLAQPAHQRVRTFLPRDPRHERNPQPDHGLRIGRDPADLVEPVPHRPRIVRREREKRGTDPRCLRTHRPETAALQQQGEPEGEARQPLQELREGAGVSRTETHVERAVQPLAQRHPAADAFRFAIEDLRRERRRERSPLRGLARPGMRLVSGHARPPAVRRDPVHAPAHRGHRLLRRQPRRDQPALPEHRVHGFQHRIVAGRQALQRGVCALRLPRIRKPRLQPLLPLPAVLLPFDRARGRRPRPARHQQAFQRRRRPPRTFRHHVRQIEAQPLALPPQGLARLLQNGPVLDPLERHVQRVSPAREPAVQPPAGNLHEPLQLPLARERARSVDAEQRHQRAIAAEQPPLGRRHRHEEALERLPPRLPPESLQVVEEHPSPAPYSRGRVMVPPPVAPNVSATALITVGRRRSPTPTPMVISAEPSPTCCG